MHDDVRSTGRGDRGVRYDQCFPLTTGHIDIGKSVTGSDGGVAGLAALPNPPSALRAVLTEEIA